MPTYWGKRQHVNSVLTEIISWFHVYHRVHEKIKTKNLIWCLQHKSSQFCSIPNVSRPSTHDFDTSMGQLKPEMTCCCELSFVLKKVIKIQQDFNTSKLGWYVTRNLLVSFYSLPQQRHFNLPISNFMDKVYTFSCTKATGTLLNPINVWYLGSIFFGFV